MYKICATEESARRQRQLEQCLQELMLTEEYHQITVGDICDRAGIARKSFYRYFSSKEGCLYALIDHAVFDGSSFYLPTVNDAQVLRNVYERFFRYWKEQHLLLDALAKNSLTLLLVERILHYSTQEEQDFWAPWSTAPADIQEQTIFCLGGVMSLLLDWHRSGFQKSPLQMAKILGDLIK